MRSPRTGTPSRRACSSPRASASSGRAASRQAGIAASASAEQPPRRPHVAEVAEQPEQHAAQAQVVREREQEAHDRAAAGGHDDAGQQEPRRGPPAGPVGDREHQQHRAEGAGCGADVDREARGARQHEPERADRGAARHAEDVGIGEGIPQQRLHQHARQRQHDAGAECGERARQAQFPDDRAHERIARREPLPGRVDAGTAERERCGDRRERRGDAAEGSMAPRASSPCRTLYLPGRTIKIRAMDPRLRTTSMPTATGRTSASC